MDPLKIPDCRERWPLGTMIVCGYVQHQIAPQLDIAQRLGATHVELYPRWATAPTPEPLAKEIRDQGIEPWSAHGPWGNETWGGGRLDLASLEPAMRRYSIEQVQRSIEWLAAAGGRCLVVHPGVLSDPAQTSARRAALMDSLASLAESAARHSVWVAVENLPRGSFPGSFTNDNASIVRELGASHVGLCLDTGHANIMADVASEARAAGNLLCSTHVHDNDGQRDSHLLPGLGTIRWSEFSAALHGIDYRGVIMLECPRFLREHPELINDELHDRLARLCCRPATESTHPPPN